MAAEDNKEAKRADLKPCERCRSQHLKCVYSASQETCQRCQKAGSDCTKSTKKIRFRDVPISRLRGERKTRRRQNISANGNEDATVLRGDVLDETVNAVATMLDAPDDTFPNTTKEVNNDDREIVNNEFSSGSVQFHFMQPITGSDEAHQTETRASPETQARAQPFSGISEKTDLAITPNSPLLDEQPANVFVHPSLPTPSEGRLSWGDLQLQSRSRIYGFERMSSSFTDTSPFSRPRSTSMRYLEQLVKARPNPADFVETVLLRYFHEELAHWFDLCDPDRHFATVIPQRARHQGPLRSAVLTIAARNMSRNKRYRNSDGIVEWKGRPIPELNEDFAVPYHNDCIRELLPLSMDPRKRYDENLLAAVLALRTDEEMGYNSDGTEVEQDQQLFLRIASVFIDAQLPPALALPHSSPTVFPSALDEGVLSDVPSPSVHTDELGASGLRQACFWTAFRQDLHASFLKQQPVRFPLSRCELFRQLTPATDAVWANRMVTFCADVLEFSYGSDSNDGQISPSYTNQGRWRDLRDREHMLCSLLPATFEPTYCSEPDADKVFPEIWYLDSCHVSGTTYIELARMLLEVFNPTRPRLGHGFLAATNAFVSSTKKILFRLCGIALSNQHCPPSLINACLGIAMFGEYFEEPREQIALLGVLDLMHDRYAYPTTQIALSLQKAWYHEDVDAVTSVASSKAIDFAR